jgi:hypothetical protein
MGNETLGRYTMSYLFGGTPLDGSEILGGCTMIDYFSVYVSRWAMKPSELHFADYFCAPRILLVA